MNQDKILVFEYIVYKFLEWYRSANPEKELEENDLSLLKVIKLHFFLCAVSSLEERQDDLFEDFNRFYALPYGPVELDIYNFIRNRVLDNFGIDRKKVTPISNFDEFVFNLKQNSHFSHTLNKVDKAIERLKEINPKLISYSAIKLVDISHKWYAWTFAYNTALAKEVRSEAMDVNMIRNGTMFFG